MASDTHIPTLSRRHAIAIAMAGFTLGAPAVACPMVAAVQACKDHEEAFTNVDEASERAWCAKACDLERALSETRPVTVAGALAGMAHVITLMDDMTHDPAWTDTLRNCHEFLSSAKLA